MPDVKVPLENAISRGELAPTLLIAAAIGTVIYVISYGRNLWHTWARRQQKIRILRGPFFEQGVSIEPVPESFAWEQNKPRKFRPFKSKYNLTMGISKPDPNDWLLLEDTYKAWTDHHRELFAGPVAGNLGLVDEADKDAVDAVEELYDYVISFLATRYPKYFAIEPSTSASSKVEILHNLILDTEMPLTAAAARAAGASTHDLFRILSENTEEDFLLMGFEEKDEEYHLRACSGVAATAFLWRSRMGMPLTQLHGPVPNYKEKLQLSMNRYFRKMQLGSIVQRTTFKVQFSERHELYKPESVIPEGQVDYKNGAHMRLERQQLFRLPRSKFILFTIRTYMYPLADIKEEGLGPDMATTIRAWPDDFAGYKRRERWQSIVYKYLDDGEQLTNQHESPLQHGGLAKENTVSAQG